MERTFQAGIASRVTGVPYRTLDYWARSKFITPSGRDAKGTGTEREYTFGDLIALRTARELRKGGVSTQALRKVVAYLRTADLQQSLGEVRLIVQGSDVLAVTTNRALISAFKSPGQYAFSFVLDLGNVSQYVEQEIRKLQAA